MIEPELKELEEIPAIPRAQLYEMIAHSNNDRNQGIMAGWFLMACRATEGLNVTTEDIQVMMGRDVFKAEISRLGEELSKVKLDVDVGKQLGRNVSHLLGTLEESYNRYREMVDLQDKLNDPSKVMAATDEVATRWPQTKVYVVKLLTLKRGVRIPRAIPIPMVDPLANLFGRMVRDVKRKEIHITRQRLWQIFDGTGVYDFYSDQGYPTPKNPLRHARLSEIDKVLNDNQLHRFAGWKLKGTKDHYVHMNWEDYVEPLVQVARRAPPFNGGV